MKPAPSASPHALWLGIAVGVAFRTFAYGLLYAGFLLPHVRGLPPLGNGVLTAIYWGVAVAALISPFWIPFAAGFLSVYFWRHLETDSYGHAIWRSAIGFFIVFIGLSLAIGLVPVVIFLSVFIFLDVGMCDKGVDWGSRFWDGRLGRQFLGDFSTLQEEDDLTHSSGETTN